jgi:PAS domain S-box-containing protein
MAWVDFATMKDQLSRLAERLRQLPPITITVFGVGALLALGALKYILPGSVTLGLLDMLVVMFVGWGAGKRPVPWVSALATLTIAIVQWGALRGRLEPGWIEAWNGMNRFLSFAIAGWLAAEFRRLHRGLGQLVQQRTAQWQREAERHRETASRLTEANHQFEQVVRNISGAFWLTDLTKHEMVYVSPGYEDLWGRKCDELYGAPESWMMAIHPADREEVRRRAETDQARGAYDVEYRICRPDGAERWIRDRAYPVRNEKGEVYRIAGIAEDVTAERQAREELRTQAAILENMAEGVVVTDEQGLIVQMNPAAERIWGHARSEILGKPASVFSDLPEAEAASLLGEVLAKLEDGGFWQGIFKNRRKDGAVILCDARISKLELEGRVLMVAVETDVTERVRAQEQLQRQARVLETVAEAVLMVDTEGTIVLTNPALDAALGYERGELVGKPMGVLSGLSQEAHQRVFQEQVQAVRQSGLHAGDYVARRKDGTMIELETRSRGLSRGEEFYLIVVGQDVTERKRAEVALRQSEETLRVFLNAIPAPAFLLDREGTILLDNPSLACSLGFGKVSFVGKNAFELLSGPVGERRKAMFEEVIRTRQPQQHEDMRGGRHFMNFESPVLDAVGNVTRVAVFALDITERKHAEWALAKQEALYRTLFELSPDGILLENMKGDIIDANQAICELFGCSREEILRQNVRRFVPAEGHAELESNLAVLRAGQALQHEVWNVRQSGERCLVWLNEKPLTLPDGREGILVVARDVTRSKRAEMIKETFLSLGTKLSEARRASEAARAIFSSADLLWRWDCGALDLLGSESGRIETVLGFDLVEQERREKELPVVAESAPGLVERLGREGGELVLWKAEEPRPASVLRFGDGTRHPASAMSAAVRAEGRGIGVLTVQSYASHAYTAEDLATLQALADHCAGALERLRVEAALRQAHEQLEQRVEERTAELQAANEARAENEARLELALDASNAGTWSWDAVRGTSRWDDRYHALYGFTVDDPMSHEAWMSRVYPEDRKRLQARIEQMVAPGGGDIWNEEFRVLHPVKGERWMAGLGHVERDESGRAVRIGGINLDVTERKRGEEAQRTQLAQIEAIYQSAPVGLCLLDTDLRYVRINERLAAMNGVSVEEHLGRTIREVVPHLAEGSQELLRKVTATGQPVLNVELQGVTTSEQGVVRFWVTNWVPLKGPDGRIRAINVLVEEITERKALHQALAASEAKYRRLHESMSDAFVAVDMTGRITDCNPAYESVTGYTAEELRQQTYLELTPENWHAFEQRIVEEEILARGYSQVYEKEYRRKDGSRLPVELRAFLIRDGEGKPSGIWAIVRDITERKAAEQALRQAQAELEDRVVQRTAELHAANLALGKSEERYRSLVDNLNVGIFRTLPAVGGGFVQVNPALARMHGFDSVEEFQRIPVAALYDHPADRTKILAELTQRGLVQDYEVRLKKRDGTPIFASVSAAVHRGADGEVDWIDGVLEDITARKRAEEALRQAEQLQKAILDNIPDPVWLKNREGRFLACNLALARFYGQKPEGVIGKTVFECATAEAALLDSEDKRAIETRRSIRMEIPIADAEQQVRWMEIIKSPIYDERGEVSGTVGAARDITQRRQAEEVLKLQSFVLQNMAEGVLLLGPDLKIRVTNRALESTFGYEPGELIGKHVSMLNARSTKKSPTFNEQVIESFAKDGLWIGEYENRRKDGSVFTSEARIRRLTLEGRVHFVSVQQDITERKQSALLLQVQRDLGVSLSLASELGPALARLLQIGVQVGGLDCGGIYLLNLATGELELVAHRGLSAGFAKSVARYSAEAPQAKLVSQGKALFTTSGKLPIPLDPMVVEEGLRAFAVLPLSHEREIIGGLVVASHKADQIPGPAQMVLEAIAAQASGAIARLRAEAERTRLERQILEISDREQARIGQDIHDGLCQQLVSLAFDANGLEGELTRQHLPEATKATRIARCLDEAITETRQLARGLFPIRLEAEGIFPALEELARTTRERFGVRCRFTSKTPVKMESRVVATHLYRIAQEAVTNAIKHGRPRSILIRLRDRGSAMELRVDDDGAGLKSGKPGRGQGMGLHIMQYRARSLGATLQVELGAGGGTMVCCCVPRKSK